MTNEAREYFLDLKQWQVNETRCKRYGVVPKRFQLFITSAIESQSTHVLHEDSGLPRRCGCPMGYEIQKALSSSPVGEKPKQLT